MKRIIMTALTAALIVLPGLASAVNDNREPKDRPDRPAAGGQKDSPSKDKPSTDKPTKDKPDFDKVFGSGNLVGKSFSGGNSKGGFIGVNTGRGYCIGGYVEKTGGGSRGPVGERSGYGGGIGISSCGKKEPGALNK